MQTDDVQNRQAVFVRYCHNIEKEAGAIAPPTKACQKMKSKSQKNKEKRRNTGVFQGFLTQLFLVFDKYWWQGFVGGAIYTSASFFCFVTVIYASISA